ncbi:MAG: nucleotidyltransferase domain-containing protein [Thermodesulfobacteriota bacterium]
MSNNFTKEQSVFLSILRSVLSENPNLNQDENLTSSELEFIIDQAVHHRVVNIVSSAFNSKFFANIPEDIINRVNELNREEVIKIMYLTNELTELNKEFNSKEIEYILLKGLALGADLYGDLNLRQIGDLDLLVRKEDIDKAATLLLNRGYNYFFDLTDRQRKIYENSSIYLSDHDMHYSFFHPVKKVSVELHWSLMPEKYSFYQKTKDVFDRKKTINIEGNEINSLSEEDLLLFLSLHGVKHGWLRLFWLCDIARFLKVKDKVDLACVIRRAESLNCSRSLFLALNSSELVIPGQLNEELIGYIKNDKEIYRISKLIRDNLFNIDNKSEKEIRDKVFVSSMERYSDKIRFYSDKIFRPTIYEIELIKLPKQLTFIYYFIRPVRLVAKYTTNLLTN